FLADQGIDSCGTGSAAERMQPAIVRRNGLVVAVLGFCDDFFVDPNGNAGVGPAELNDADVAAAVSAARKIADVVVVNLHWGYEWALHPMRSQRDRARAIADAGAAVVLCHHAHVPMAVEMYRGSVIAHGLGNCAFPFRRTVPHPWRNASYALQVNISDARVVGATAVPTRIRDDHRIELASGRPKAAMLGGLRRLLDRLHDDEWLGKVEECRLNREAAKAVRSLQNAMERSEGTFAERCAWLRTPRQQRLLAHVRHGGSAFAPIASVLETLASAHQSPADRRSAG